MLKTKPLWRAILLYASLAAYISMAFDCFIWMDPQTPKHYLLSGTLFGVLMAIGTRCLNRRTNQKPSGPALP